MSNENCECEKGWWNFCVDVGADLKRNVLPNGLDPVGDELVDDVPWVVGPLGYTVCMCVCVCVSTHMDAL